jgi:hypothetical protein
MKQNNGATISRGKKRTKELDGKLGDGKDAAGVTGGGFGSSLT